MPKDREKDREGDFEPLIVRNRQKTITGIEDQMLALYAKGVSCREIQDHLEPLYRIEVSFALKGKLYQAALAGAFERFQQFKAACPAATTIG